MCPLLKCRYCPETFSYQPLRVAHEKVHTDDEPLTCQACGKTFRQHGRLEFHVEHFHGNTSSDETDDNNNSVVQQILSTKDVVDLTKDSSSDAETNETSYFICDLCPATFDKFDDYSVHLQSHFLGRNHVCDKCSESFLSMQELRGHMATYHSTVKKHECGICEVKFSTILELEDHAASHSKSKFNCNLCEKSYSHFHSLRFHKWRAHSWSPFKCEDCGRIMQYKAQLKKHRSVYHGVGKEDYNYECKICKKKFPDKYHLKEHSVTHSGITYSCPDCGVKYKKRETLTKHMRDVHTQPDNLTCTVCQVQLRNLGGFKNHMKMHEREQRLLAQREQEF